MKIICLVFIGLLISFQSQSQLKNFSVMQYGELGYFVTWFRTTNYKTFKLSNNPKDSLHIKDCVYEKLKNARLQLIRVYKCELNQFAISEVKDFKTDFSEFVRIPFFDFYVFNQIDSSYDELLFKIEDYYYFNRRNSIYCGDDGFEEVWSDIKREVKAKGWDLFKINIYEDDGSLHKLGFLVEYEGVSYKFEGDKLVPLMEYLEQNYTLEEYKEMFYGRREK